MNPIILMVITLVGFAVGRITKKSELLKGGLSIDKSYNLRDVEESVIEKGTDVEMEHFPKEEKFRFFARKIALDHLAETRKYYDYLYEMERKYK